MANTNRTKVCSKCRQDKSIDLFGKNRRNKDGLQYYCKECRVLYLIKNKDHINGLRRNLYPKHKDKNLLKSHKRNRTLNGKIKTTYTSIKCRVSKKYKTHYYGLDVCSSKTFYNFSINNINLRYLMIKWELSGYERKHTPSIDRIDPSKGYVMGNMQWITLSNNVKRSFKKNNIHAQR